MTNSFTTSGLFGDLFHDTEIASHFGAAAFLKHATAFEVAWTETLKSLGAVPASDADAAIDAIRARVPDLLALADSSNANGMPIPGFMTQLRDGLDDRTAQAIHTGTTSQDVIDTVMVLMLMDILGVLDARLGQVLDALTALERDADGTLIGRTRMQAALPIPVKARVHAWLTPLRDHHERLASLRAHVGQVQLGGPVGLRDTPDGQGDAAAMELARRLGLRMGPVWHTNRTPILDVGHWLVLVTGSLGKMGQDIALMAQQGIDEVKLTGGGGSSAMPHKENPVLAETLVTLARFVAVQQGGLAQALLHEQERSGAAWALEWMILPAMAEATGASLRHAHCLIDQITRLGPA
ncbi:3-carboxy-cis,cis-muconate cycloisomerase [Marivita hallyeonensis]|uniref:3-carboxy-cis,cis-muconate cycloisomerase n=1 Tax=Marivita hallyeonensis TaxID=996342 RepID=A0A1M5X6D5_9RHOB|nr:3-carboxy-cis,cis-muconate cycloisomerase [Marivita hallyeonensis]SHH95064.1 3-carboxy-cis,cis-muconate cycloisomerase [Marivita hallyeonensis]